ncbi:hypothetical protein GM661_04690 [Iocasia frigidifontis]|uniref:DUF1468 domain-containing protein n=1 Tax=Iocasia fonsfrigidae TaxID=2682810 RepID=A0A8A7K7D3_9FIRM|nr:hypothetical protein GM661_04690 [Iocasia fonsfrigidae]
MIVKEKDMPKVDFITSIVLIVFSIAVIVMSLQMPRFEYRGANPWSVPGIVPGILGVSIGLMGIALLVRSIKRKGHNLGISKEKLIDWLHKPASIRLLLTILLTLIYAWGLIGSMPYILATFLFITVFIIIFEYNRKEKRQKKTKKMIVAIMIGLIAAAAVSALFQYAFMIRLP